MKKLLVISNVVYVLIGVTNTMLGPLLPTHAARFGLSDKQCGALFLAQFVGGFVGAIASTELSKRLGLRNTIRLGFIAIAAGSLGTTAPSLPVVLGSVALYGIGLGFCSPTITAAVSEASPNGRAAALNVLNFSWTVGAIIAPALLMRLNAAPGIGFAGAMFVITTLSAASALGFPKVAEASAPTSLEQIERLSPGLLRLIIATGAVTFIYVGTEGGVAGWLPTLATRIHAFSADRAALLQGVLWAALLAGRFTAPFVLRYRSEQTVLRATITVALAGTVGIISAHSGVVLFVSVFVAGFGFAPVFPTAIGYVSQRLGNNPGARLGWMFASAGLGGAVLPYCVGFVSSATGNFILGYSTLIFAECLLFCANLLVAKQARLLEQQAQVSTKFAQ